MDKIILASKSKVRKEILDKNNIINRVEPSNVDEDSVKNSLLKQNVSPEIISKNLAELKANKVSQKNPNLLVLGADSVIDLNGELISKPQNREEALIISAASASVISALTISSSTTGPATLSGISSHTSATAASSSLISSAI